MWMHCNAVTSQTHDVNVHRGKYNPTSGTFVGERVVNEVASLIRDKDVTLVFDRLFISVHLIDSINLAAVGTCIKSEQTLKKKMKKKIW